MGNAFAPMWATLYLVFLVLISIDYTTANTDVHIAFLTDCTKYSDWQTVAMAFSYKQTRQPGRATRIMCCTEEERKRYNHQLLNLMHTHVAKSFTYDEKTNDHYAAFNKPGALYDWLGHVTPEENWILVMDSGNTRLHADWICSTLMAVHATCHMVSA